MTGRAHGHAGGDRAGERGVALIAVVMVLAGLLVLAGPFAASMWLRARRSADFAADARARLAAEGALDRALWSVSRTSESLERVGYYGYPFDSPDWDGLDELAVDFNLRGVDPKGFNDPRGTMWHVEVQDEQGKINVHSAPAHLVGALFAATTLGVRIDAADTTALFVADARDLAADDDPLTVDGFVLVDSEVIAYRDLDRETNTLSELDRGCWGTVARRHAEGAPVVDGVGWLLAEYPRLGARSIWRPMNLPRDATLISTRLGGGARLTPGQFERAERYLTTDSFRAVADGWVRRERVLNGSFDGSARTIRVQDAANYGPGTRVRFTLPSGRQVVRRVRSARTGRFVLETNTGFSKAAGDDVYVQAELRHPVNVNTASPDVLRAIFTGVKPRGGGPMGPWQALAITSRVLAHQAGGRSVLRNIDDFASVLDAAVAAREIDARQRGALLANARESGPIDLDRSTVPFTYRTFGDFTIEASAVVNSPAGLPVARARIREVVHVPDLTPERVTQGARRGEFVLRSQKEFEAHLRAGLGRRVVTWPEPMLDPARAPDERTEPGVGDVRLEPVKIGDRSEGKITLLDHCDDPKRHKDLTPDGLDLGDGGAVSCAASSVFARSSRDRTISPGSFSMWVKPRNWGVGGHTFFEAGGGKSDADLVRFYYDSGASEMVLELGDGTEWGQTVEYRLPVVFAREYNGDWVHVTAGWHGTHPGGQSIRLDAGAGHVRPGAPYFHPMTALSVAVDDWSGRDPALPRSISVASTADFPDTGALRIGHEVIEYDGRTATLFQNCRRGRRYTDAAAHEAGEVIVPFGYANDLSGDLYEGKGHLASSLGRNTRCRIDEPPDPMIPGDPGGIDDADDEIPVDDASGFPDCGYVWIGEECIYFGRRRDDRLLDCERGQLGTPARDHRHNRRVENIALHITDHALYPDGGLVAVGTGTGLEWISYQRRRTHGGHEFLMPSVNTWTDRNGVQHWSHGSFRAQRGTSARDHGAGDKVIPVFHVRWPHCGNPSSPADEVTVVDNLNHREPRRVTRAYASTGYSSRSDTFSHTFLVSLNDFVTRRFRTGDGVRLLKFPSGELPIRVENPARVGAGRAGVLAAEIDEIRFTNANAPAGRLTWATRVGAGDASLTVVTPKGASVPTSGVVSVDGELVYYTAAAGATVSVPFGPTMYDTIPPPRRPVRDTRSHATVRLSGCRRGVLGTRAVPHEPGAPCAFLDEYDVTDLTGAAGRTADAFSLRRANAFASEGYALVNNETVGYTGLAGNRLTGAARLRGRFGTLPELHAAGSLVQHLPARYPDRHILEDDSSDLAYYQASFAGTGALWRRVLLTAPFLDARTFRLRTLVRFDGAPGWDAQPVNAPGGLYEFHGLGPHVFDEAQPVRADQVELRVFVEYREGVLRSNAWKRTPAIDEISVTYANPLIVRRREVIE